MKIELGKNKELAKFADISVGDVFEVTRYPKNHHEGPYMRCSASFNPRFNCVNLKSGHLFDFNTEFSANAGVCIIKVKLIRD